MKKEDSKALLATLKNLANDDIVVQTYLKLAEVEVRLDMIGEKVSKDFIEESIISSRLKKLIVSIITTQIELIAALNRELDGYQRLEQSILQSD